MDLKRARDFAHMLTPFSHAAAFSGIASWSGERSDYVEAFRACHEIMSEQDRVRRVDAILTALYVAQNRGYVDTSGNAPLGARDSLSWFVTFDRSILVGRERSCISSLRVKLA